MIYFETCYKGATNHRGSRIGVKRSDDTRYKWFSYDYGASCAHRSAFIKFILKYWPDFADNGKQYFLESGGNKGNVYCFMPEPKETKYYGLFQINGGEK